MLSTTQEQQARWTETQAHDFLESRGYRQDRSFTWRLPHSGYRMTDREADAVGYLIFEWDEAIADATAFQWTTIIRMHKDTRGPWDNGNL